MLHFGSSLTPRGVALLFAAASLTGCGRAAQEPVREPPSAVTAPALASSAPEPSAARPPVVVTIVVDQLAAWVAAERLEKLPQDGGFARLLREGTYVREARFAHATTDTAPGHAALYTGAPPRDSGVVLNEKLDLATRKAVSVYYDSRSRLVAKSGVTESPSSSAEVLAAQTLADALRASSPRALIVGLSIKDRGSVPGAGRQPTASLWFDVGRDEFVTSSAFGERIPEVLAAAASKDSVVALRATPWQPLEAAWVQKHASTPDAQAGEGRLPGWETSFPYDYSKAQSPARAFRVSPSADVAVLGMATALIRAPEFGREPTLLTLSLSANDYVGHVFGPQSWEIWDNLLRLDRSLAALFRELDERLGPTGYAVVLSSDHGIAPLPEAPRAARPWCDAATPDRWQRPCKPGTRLHGEELAKLLGTVAKRTLGAGDWLEGVAEPYVFLSASARALAPERRTVLVRALRAALEKHPGIAQAVDTSALPNPCPGPEDESVEALVCRAFGAGSGALHIVPAVGSFFDPEYTPDHGSSHGTPYLYDRAIPILARAPGRIPAGRVMEEPQSYAVFTRTVAALLGIAPPSACSRGADLTTAR